MPHVIDTSMVFRYFAVQQESVFIILNFPSVAYGHNQTHCNPLAL